MSQRDVLEEQDIVTRYNYDVFEPGKFDQFMSFEDSPKLGDPAPDAPLWRLDDRGETTLSAFWSQCAYTVVEFGSFT